MDSRLFSIALLGFMLPVPAAGDIFQCKVDNRTVFSDKPCPDGRMIEVKASNTLPPVRSADLPDTTRFYSSNQWLEGTSGYRRALQLADIHQAPMLIFFHVDWCPYSKAVETGLLPHPTAIQAMTPFIKVRINPENGDEENRIFKSMGGSGYPRMVAIPYQKQWRRISVTHSKGEIHSEKHISAIEFSGNLAPFQPLRPLDTAKAHHQRAREMLGLGKITQAVRDAKAAIRQEPSNFDHYKLLDDALIRSRDFKQIITHWNQFIRLSPDNHKAYLERAGAHRHNGDMKSAIADLKASAALGNQEAARLYQHAQGAYP